MFKETIRKIDLKIERINYELGRENAAYSKKEIAKLKNCKEELWRIRVSCDAYDKGFSNPVRRPLQIENYMYSPVDNYC